MALTHALDSQGGGFQLQSGWLSLQIYFHREEPGTFTCRILGPLLLSSGGPHEAAGSRRVEHGAVELLHKAEGDRGHCVPSTVCQCCH